MSKKIVLIRFSSREFGNCSGVAQYLESYHINDTVQNFKIDHTIVQPCGGCDYECLKPNSACAGVTVQQRQLMDEICHADLVYYIIPNYCGFPPASCYAFNERSVGYFNKNRDLMSKYRSVPKKFIIISNTEGQNFESLIKSQVVGNPDLIYLKTSKYKVQSTAGNLMDSAEATSDLKAFLDR